MAACMQAQGSLHSCSCTWGLAGTGLCRKLFAVPASALLTWGCTQCSAAEGFLQQGSLDLSESFSGCPMNVFAWTLDLSLGLCRLHCGAPGGLLGVR